MQGEVLEDIATQVTACGGPVDSGTKPEPVKWHDDKVSNHINRC